MVQPLDVADRLAHGGRIHELSSGGKALGMNRAYRLYRQGGPEYSRSMELRLGSGESATPSTPFPTSTDSPRWLIGVPTATRIGRCSAMPANGASARCPRTPVCLARPARPCARCTIHRPGPMSNLSRGIDQDWVAVDFVSTFRRLERYRRKIGISADLIEQANQSGRPLPQSPVPRTPILNPRT